MKLISVNLIKKLFLKFMPLDSLLGQINPVHTITAHVFKIRFNVILIFMSGFPRRSRKDVEVLYHVHCCVWPGSNEDKHYYRPDTATSGPVQRNSADHSAATYIFSLFSELQIIRGKCICRRFST